LKAISHRPVNFITFITGSKMSLCGSVAIKSRALIGGNIRAQNYNFIISVYATLF